MWEQNNETYILFPHSRTYGKYIFKDRKGTFYFRIVTPLKIQQLFPLIQRETRRSLGTCNQRIAKRKAIALYFSMNSEFEKIFTQAETIDKALLFIPAYLALKTNVPKERASRLKAVLEFIVNDNRELLTLKYMEDLSNRQSEVINRIKVAVETIEAQSIDHGLDSSILDKSFEFLIESIRKLTALISNESTRYNEPDSSRTFDNSPSTPPASISQVAFSKVASDFASEMMAGGNWGKKNRNSYLATFSLFERLLGNDLDIASIDQSISREFKAKLNKIPSSWNKSKRWKGMTYAEVESLNLTDQSELLSNETINKHIQRMSSLLGWCVEQGYTNTNPMEGKKIKVRNGAKEEDKRDSFSTDDLNKIFSTEIFLDNNFRHPYYFWLPLIALYSGARIQEICQLELADIKEVDDILVFSINKNSDHKKLKNRYSERYIPVHNKLKEIGLEREIRRLKRLGKKYLFEELHKNASHGDGQWTSQGLLDTK